MNEQINEHEDDRIIDKIMSMLDERLDIESLAGAVEHLHFSNRLNEKLKQTFGEIRAELDRVFGDTRNRVIHSQVISAAIQQEVRDLILDVALLKRAAATVGHIGVLERRKVERELVLELLPPSRPREGAGVQVAPAQCGPIRRVNCEDRLHLCKAACCRIFDASLTVAEVESDRYDWDPKRPYSLRRERTGCVHLKGGTCSCSVYHDRPQTCRTYSCENDPRIWSDFANMVINPSLSQRLEGLNVVTGVPSNDFVAGTTPQPSHTAPDITPQPDLAERQHTQPEHTSGPAVAPPNFDDLRKLVIPRLNKLFVPPRPDNGSGHNSPNSN